jgi:hypothetical protein
MSNRDPYSDSEAFNHRNRLVGYEGGLGIAVSGKDRVALGIPNGRHRRLGRTPNLQVELTTRSPDNTVCAIEFWISSEGSSPKAHNAAEAGRPLQKPER